MSCLSQEFESALPSRSGVGEALCVWRHGSELLHLCVGEAKPSTLWTADTLVPIFSATKTFSAACVLLALHDKGLAPDMEIGELWERFPAPHCTVAELLSHQTGLAAWALTGSVHDIDACRRAIEATRPAWMPPQHGYHPHTIGPIVDILMLELVGERLGEYWERKVRYPLGLDLFIGLPESEYERVAQLRAPRISGSMPRSPFYSLYFDPSSAVYRAFHSVAGIESLRDMNAPSAWSCACPARGGIASARGLAMAYQALLGELAGSPFPPEVQAWLRTPCCRGMDLILQEPTAFCCGPMCEPAELFGHGGFGHAGAGGFHAFADPATGCSFAYVMNQMQLGVLPGDRVRALVSAYMQDCA